MNAVSRLRSRGRKARGRKARGRKSAVLQSESPKADLEAVCKANCHGEAERASARNVRWGRRAMDLRSARRNPGNLSPDPR